MEASSPKDAAVVKAPVIATIIQSEDHLGANGVDSANIESRKPTRLDLH